MKVAVSIPDDLFADADRIARQLGTSRSAVYAKALTAFVRRHSDDAVTKQINAVIAEIGEEDRELHRKASKRFAERNEW